ncbi:MAG: LysR family transcriptional regulator [Proteobacteria bacterium]|nr:LysR family transcriptional regulator [Pseudomonadota bacterium]
MRHATLRQLRVFAVTARLLNFSRAAEELHLTQPAVSAQIRELEDHAGLPLFERVGRKTYLTAAGTELRHYAEAILVLVREADEAMARLQGVAGGKLNVSVISAGDYFFPRLVAAFIARHAGITLELAVHNREDLLRALADNTVDLAVMVRPPEDADTVQEAFAPHAYVLVAAATHPLARMHAIPVERVLRERFVMRERGSDTWIAMQEAFGRRARHVDVAMEIRSNETIKQAVQAGMGISFMSGHAVVPEVRSGQLAVLDVVGFPARRNWYVVHRRSKRLPPVALAFKAFLLAEAAGWIERDMAVAAPPGDMVRPRKKPRGAASQQVRTRAPRRR